MPLNDGTVRVPTGVTEPGAETVLAAVREAAAETDVDVYAVGPTGIGATAPLVLVTRNGRTAIHERCSPELAVEIVETIADGSLPEEGARDVVDPGIDQFPTPGTGPLATGGRRVLASAGWVRPASIEDHGAFACRRDDRPSRQLLGRGRGDGASDQPIEELHEHARSASGDPVVVVNANEADDRVLADRFLLEALPMAVIDGAMAVAERVGATEIVVYSNERHDIACRRAEVAARALEGHIDDTDEIPDVSVQVVAGPDEFVAAEPTMALEALEGSDRLEARRRPPGPEEYGLYGRPTVIHTPRTLVQLRAGLVDPGSIKGVDPGTRLVTVGGDVDRRAVVELDAGRLLGDCLDAVDRNAFGFACVGGRFGGFTERLDVPPTARALDSAGFGTNGAVELFDGERCPVAQAGKRARLAEHNCGRCVPCREGATQLVGKLREIYDGTLDDDGIRELCRTMRTSSLCSFGREAPRPVTTAMEVFEPTFRAHADGSCPSGVCES